MNQHALKGMRCPKCAREEPLRIETRTWVAVYDERIDEIEDPVWDATSPCMCPECLYSGTVQDFTKPQEKHTA